MRMVVELELIDKKSCRSGEGQVWLESFLEERAIDNDGRWGRLQKHMQLLLRALSI